MSDYENVQGRRVPRWMTQARKEGYVPMPDFFDFDVNRPPNHYTKDPALCESGELCDAWLNENDHIEASYLVEKGKNRIESLIKR